MILFIFLHTSDVFYSLQKVRQDFDNFEKLFSRFLLETGPSVEWEKIKLLPDEAVSIIVVISWTHWS